MRLFLAIIALIALTAVPYAQQTSPPPSQPASYIGFDRNEYPGDAALSTLRQHFSFVGYWLTNPPEEHQNTWQGKRDILLRQGFGFLVLANGRLDAEILKSQRSGTNAAALGQRDAATAIAAAHREHFPANTILFLDQEEGGRLLSEQMDYLLAWTEAVAHADYLPGVYASGQPVSEGHGQTITTVQDIRARITAQHLHPVALFVYQDACPPSNGCTLRPPAITTSGAPDLAAWQYAQSPRRPEITRTCAKTYGADGNCYAPGLPKLYLDLSVSNSSDPSHGR